MKNLFGVAVLTLALAFLGCVNKNSAEKTSDLDSSGLLEFAESISKDILNAQRQGGFYNLSDKEAIPEMVKGLNENVQKSSYEKIKAAFGNYKSLALDTVVAKKQDKIYHIFRFKGEFEMSNNVEVRTVLDADGRLAGFFVLPWKPEL